MLSRRCRARLNCGPTVTRWRPHFDQSLPLRAVPLSADLHLEGRGVCRLVVVGDVHDAWGPRDEAALKFLQPSMVLFVGDFGNENLQVVSQVAALDLPKAVVLGNHDAWYTMVPKPRKRPLAISLSSIELLQGLCSQRSPTKTLGAKDQSSSSDSDQLSFSSVDDEQGDPGGDILENYSDRELDSASESEAGSSSTDGNIGTTNMTSSTAISGVDYGGVIGQLEMLGRCHVGFSSMSYPQLPVSIVGGRPFSKGGHLDTVAPFFQRLYNMSTIDQFSSRILQEGLSAAAMSSASIQDTEQQNNVKPLVLLAHNGPSGLGKEPFNMCGIDWRSGAGDHGDPDLEHAIAQLHEAGVKLPLVCFGHMHHVLKGMRIRREEGLIAESLKRDKRGSSFTIGGKALRQMVHVDPIHGTVYLNAATVPRVRKPPHCQPVNIKKSGGGKVKKSKKGQFRHALLQQSTAAAVALGEGPSIHHFMVVELSSAAEVQSAKNTWVQVGEDRSNSEENIQIFEEHEVFRRVEGKAYDTLSYYDAHHSCFKTHNIPSLR